MKRLSLAFVLVLSMSLIAVSVAQTAPSVTARASAAGCTGAISWRSAATAVGRIATIKGRVAGTHFASSSNGSPTFLNIGVDYPSTGRFVVVIWIENRARFGAPETRYAARTICVRGRISLYQGIPEIEATTPSQIRIVG